MAVRLNLDPWQVCETWTWARFWNTFEYLESRAKEDARAQRLARVKAGLERPKLVDKLQDIGIGG